MEGNFIFTSVSLKNTCKLFSKVLTARGQKRTKSVTEFFKINCDLQSRLIIIIIEFIQGALRAIIYNMRTIYLIYNRIERPTYKYKRKIIIAPQNASHKHTGVSRGNLLKQCFFFFFFGGVIEIDFYSTVSISPA